MTTRTSPVGRIRLGAAVIGCSVLIGAAVGPALATVGATHGAAGISTESRLRLLRAETVGAADADLDDHDELIDADDGDVEETEAADHEGSQPTEPAATPSKHVRKQEKVRTAVAAKTHQTADEQSDSAESNDVDDGDQEDVDQEDEQDGEHDDADSGSEHDDGDAGEHDSGEHDDGDSGGD